VPGTRQRQIFADGWTLPSAGHPAKAALPEAFIYQVPPGLAPSKDFLYRVPDKKHPANHFAPGKSVVPYSEPSHTISQVTTFEHVLCMAYISLIFS
jgi:hypothetical protein